MKIRNLTILSLILVVLLIFTGCGESGTNDFPEESEYSQETLQIGSVNRFSGVVVASGETKIQKDESKTLGTILVSVGDTVEAGQVLFTYDGTEAQKNYEKAVIELEQMQISLQSYGEQKAQLETEKAAASEEEQLEYTLQIQELDTTIRETSYNITLKQKEVEKFQQGLSSLEVTAPTAGKVQSINNPDSGGQSETSSAFMVLVSTSSYQIKASISEENISDLTVGDPVLIRSRIDDTTWKGTVASVDYTNPAQSQGGYSDGMTTESSVSTKYPFYVNLENSSGLMLGQHVFVEKEITEQVNTSMDTEPESEGSSETK